jgi:RNA polymerase sigma-70 factor (ECF subfamily)
MGDSSYAVDAEWWNFSCRLDQCRSEVDEAGLLEQARRGDAAAFSRLFGRYQGPIYRYAAHMCGREGADDVVQETFLALLRDPVRFDPARGTLGGYLFGIARHHVFRRLRSRTPAETGEDLDDALLVEAAAQPTALDHLARAEMIAGVREAVASLPAIYREVVVLCELQEMSYVDAAGVVDCPVGTVRSRLHRARALLATKLSRLAVAGDIQASCRKG